MAQVNETKMVKFNGVFIQENLIQNVVQNDDLTSVLFKNGISVTYGPQKADARKIPSIKLGILGYTDFSNVDGAKIKGTPEKDKIKVQDSKNVEVDTGAGNDYVRIFFSENVKADTGAGDDKVLFGCINNNIHINGNKNTKIDGEVDFKNPNINKGSINGVPKENIDVPFLKDVKINP